MKLGFFTMPIHPVEKDWRLSLKEDIPSLRWLGANRAELTALCRELDAQDILDRVPRWRE